MNTEVLFLVTDDTGKKDKVAAKDKYRVDNFLVRALAKNAESKKRYPSPRLQKRTLQRTNDQVRLQVGESWLLTG